MGRSLDVGEEPKLGRWRSLEDKYIFAWGCMSQSELSHVRGEVVWRPSKLSGKSTCPVSQVSRDRVLAWSHNFITL